MEQMSSMRVLCRMAPRRLWEVPTPDQIFRMDQGGSSDNLVHIATQVALALRGQRQRWKPSSL
jgi:hypothetical protein